MAAIEPRKTFRSLRSVEGYRVGTSLSNDKTIVDANGVMKELYIEPGTPGIPTAATGVLTFSGTVNKGEKITIGPDVYEFVVDSAPVDEEAIPVDLDGKTAVAATGHINVEAVPLEGETIVIGDFVLEYDTDGKVEGDNLAIDVAGDSTAASRVFTITGAITDGETITIGNHTYELDIDGDGVTEGNIPIYIDAAAAADKTISPWIIASAINNNSASVVTAVGAAPSDGTVTVTAKHKGTATHEAGDAEVALGKVMTNASWAGDYLAGGADPTAEQIRDAIVANNGAITTITVAADGSVTKKVNLTMVAEGSHGNAVVLETTDEAAFDLSDETLTGGSDATNVEAATEFTAAVPSDALYTASRNTAIVTITVKSAGAAANAWDTVADVENAAFGAAKMVDGEDGDPSVAGKAYIDEDYLYIAFEDSADGTGWLRFAKYTG